MRRKTVIFLLMVFAACSFILPTAFAEKIPEYEKAEDMGGAVIGLLTGMPFEEMVREKVPDIGGFAYFLSMPDEVLALKGRKIDGIFINNALIDFAAANNEDLVKMSEHYLDSNFGFAFPKGDPQQFVWKEIIDRMIADGTIDQLWEKWMNGPASGKTMPKQDWPGNNGTVRVACADSFEPMSYVGENKTMMGFDVEILLTVARELDLKVEFTSMEFGALMPTVQSGKADMAIGDIVITAERAEIMDFVPYAPAYFTILIRTKSTDEASADGGNFWESLKDSFDRTFVKEARYKMILSGFGITVAIAVLAGIIGTLLAFELVFLRHMDRPSINKIINIYCSLIAGIPAAVILMMLYYIIFGSSELPAFIVAVIGFSLIFCARAYGVIWNAVGAVDKGQMEAALALGYDENKAFREVVLPQAMPLYLPILQQQFILMLKETSVAGYITVLDLTRSGDLIRSRTMEAFFPLIAIAVIYFLLTILFTKLLGLIDLSAKNRHDSRKIKGVD